MRLFRQSFATTSATTRLCYRSTRFSSSSSPSASSTSSSTTQSDKLTNPATKSDTTATSTVAKDQVQPGQPLKTKKQRLADLDKDAIKAFEERFGGAADTQLGELVNGVPQGMARNVQRNMFRII